LRGVAGRAAEEGDGGCGRQRGRRGVGEDQVDRGLGQEHDGVKHTRHSMRIRWIWKFFQINIYVNLILN